MSASRYQVVVIGSSWGGFEALTCVLGGLADDFCASILIAQHRAEDVVPSQLARMLDARSPFEVREARDDDEIRPGQALLAPAGYHLLAEAGHVRLSTEGRRNHSRPSVDELFESAAAAYGPRVMAVVLTGANEDGADGVRAVKRAGGFVIAQDPATAVRSEMPEAAIATGSVDRVLPLERIPGLLSAACGHGMPVSGGREGSRA